MKCPKCHFDNPEDSKFCKECGTRIFPWEEIPISQTETLRTPIRELTRGSTFSKRYKVIEKLGKGGMGKVYKVMDKKIDEEIALKLLNPEIANDEEMIKRFKNELKFARRISHENICRMYHLSDVEGIYYITMEYVSGEDLKSMIKRVGSLSPGKAIIIAKQVCEGLAQAHKLGVVHRDLKPQNIMIDREGNVRIMDFGISRSIKAKGITQTGIMIGTPDYMSPEQVEGEEADQFSDIYSLGVILYEMVTGRVPFEGNTPLSIAFKHKTEMPPSPKELNNQISEGFSKVILKCMEKDKEKRYQKVVELLSELINIEKGIPITDKVLPKRKTDRLTQKKRFKPLFIPGILLLAIVIIVGGYFSYNKFLKPGKEGTEEKIAAVPEKKPQTKEALPVAPLYGQIEISSTPEEAEVYLDDNREGLTPFKRELTPGTYRIRLKKSPEYRDYTDVLKLKAGETLTKNFKLVPVPKSTKPKTPLPKKPKPKATVYTVRISTNPSGADVRVDGAYKGKTPISIDLSKRRSRLKIERGAEWSVIDESITLEPGSNSFHRDLRRIKYNLSIRTYPPDARVLIGNELFGTTPVNKLASVGECKIKIEKDGYGTIEDTVNIVADTEKTYDLEKLKPGKFVLKASPYAEILIDGRLIGEVPPMMIQEVEAGKHTIEFVAMKLNKRFSVEVEIGTGESKEIRMNMATGESKIVKISSLQK